MIAHKGKEVSDWRGTQQATKEIMEDVGLSIEPNTQFGNLRTRLHPNCIVCNTNNSRGLGLAFVLRADDRVAADFELDNTYEGYRGCPHGGVACAILDASMGQWLFAHGLSGVTAELNIRFRHPIQLGEAGTVLAELKRSSHPLYILKAQVVQNGQIMARATGKFVHKSELAKCANGNYDNTY